ncbi:type II toxin-antitoxin system HicB family antitoxin [Crocosphaera sp. UHCC 0190]|nr:type II toxin-antitoxin system HicB family antitoxin [Crocosphaera sp. UHCC 0190]MEA5511618.1 type II toxin-antitoxin system HicB family antitoxin [Crocosphaera sp. UHCC 0190]
MNIPERMVIEWSAEDNCYLVHLPNFPFQQFHPHGETYEEAAKHGQEVIESSIEWYQAEGKTLPIPKIVINVAA